MHSYQILEVDFCSSLSRVVVSLSECELEHRLTHSCSR